MTDAATDIADWNPCATCRCAVTCFARCCPDHDEPCEPGRLCCPACPEQWHPQHPETIDCVRAQRLLPPLPARPAPATPKTSTVPADVRHLADVLTDAYMRGIRNGPYTLARAILDVGYRRVAAAEPTADKSVQALVLAACGHWWRESRPAHVKVRPDQPRVCSQCKPTHPAAVGTSPQGLAMVPVTYLPDPGREMLP